MPGSIASLRVSESSAIKWLQRYRKTGQRAPVGTGGHRPSVLAPHRDFLEAIRLEQPGITLQALCDRPDVSRRRAQWRKYQGRIDPSRLVFIDETWARTDMMRTHGWAPRGERFLACVEQALVPTLNPSDVVVLDNLGTHKGKAVRQAIRKAGAHLIFLPKYSPGLNPIEQVFAKLKTLLRKKAARTVDAICDNIGQLLESFTPKECANCIKNAGYAST